MQSKRALLSKSASKVSSIYLGLVSYILFIAVEHERDEKDKLIVELRQFSHHNEHLQRDYDLQQSMLDKLKQQLVDEKLKAQNLVADACAAEKRADGLAKVRDENRELTRQIQQLKNEQATQSGSLPRVTQLQDELTQKENEISKLLEQIRQIQSEVNNDEQHLAEGKIILLFFIITNVYF